jgi:sterol O-acyltransferase
MLALKTACCIMAGYMMLTDMVLPYIEIGDQISGVELIARIILPLCVFMILIFYIIWECILNFFGEITRFGDR